MQGVCEFAVVDSRQQPGLDSTKIFTHVEENVPKRRDGGIDSTGSGQGLLMDCSKPSGFREDECDLDHLSEYEILNKGIHCGVGWMALRRTEGRMRVLSAVCLSFK
jgi:hypothetical protein